MKKILNIILPIIAIAVVAFFSYKAYESATKLEKVNKEYYETQSDIGKLLEIRFKSLLSAISFGALDEDKEKLKLQKLKAQKIVLEEEAKKDIINLAIAIGAVVLLFFILSLDSYAFTLASVSLITLFFGVITPILMIVIHKDIKYLGDVVLSFESKTIISTISHLYHNGNYPIALVILLFSIIVPFLKSMSMLLVIIWKELKVAQTLVKFFKHLGKWSMLDVFVVSLLLVYLSAGSSENSYSQIQNGTYMFLMYVIVSILTSICVDKLLQNNSSK
jgi:hypothetical protein